MLNELELEPWVIAERYATTSDQNVIRLGGA